MFRVRGRPASSPSRVPSAGYGSGLSYPGASPPGYDCGTIRGNGALPLITRWPSCGNAACRRVRLWRVISDRLLVPWPGWSAGVRERGQSVSVAVQGRGQLAACRLGIASGILPPFAARPAAPPMYRPARCDLSRQDFSPGLPPRVHDTGFSCAFSRVLSGCRREQPERLRFHTKAQPDASDRSPASPRLTLASTTGPRYTHAENCRIAACSATSRTGIRKRALITVLCGAGLRISEALRCARPISTGAPRGTRHGRQRPQATDGRPGLRRHGHHPAMG